MLSGGKPITKRLYYDSVIPRVARIIGEKVSGGCQERREGKMGNYCLMGIEFQLLQDGKSSGDDVVMVTKIVYKCT